MMQCGASGGGGGPGVSGASPAMRSSLYISSLRVSSTQLSRIGASHGGESPGGGRSAEIAQGLAHLAQVGGDAVGSGGGRPLEPEPDLGKRGTGLLGHPVALGGQPGQDRP